jgi:hypothetical protein
MKGLPWHKFFCLPVHNTSRHRQAIIRWFLRKYEHTNGDGLHINYAETFCWLIYKQEILGRNNSLLSFHCYYLDSVIGYSVGFINGKDLWRTQLGWPHMAWHICTKFHDDRFRHLSNIKGITSTVSGAVVLALLMRENYDIRNWDDFK